MNESFLSRFRKLVSKSVIHPAGDTHSSEDRSDDVGQLIDFTKERLKTLYCEKYQFGGRFVFGKKETVDGFMLTSASYYTWPSGQMHTKARDSHPDLQERFPVPDDQVHWDSERGSVGYKPKYANDNDSLDPNLVHLAKNPCGR